MTGKASQPRDENGHRVPRDGTLSKSIYELASLGMQPMQMAARLNVKPLTVRVLLFRIRNPARANELARRHQNKNS